jgi:hypothetical protein
MKGFFPMQNIRAILLTVAGVALVGLTFVFAASLTVAFTGILALVMIGRAISLRLKPAPVHARTTKGREQEQMRIWNDGRGTIIDL